VQTTVHDTALHLGAEQLHFRRIRDRQLPGDEFANRAVDHRLPGLDLGGSRASCRNAS
jgi:hypothetical protein